MSEAKSRQRQSAECDEVRAGQPLPWGVHHVGEGVNFALFSRNATRVRLEFYDGVTDGSPSRVTDLDPAQHRTGDVWHVWVRGVRHGQLYAYRVDGPHDPHNGHRFNVHKLLLDPFAMAIAGLPKWDFLPARGYDPSADPPDLSISMQDDAADMPKCVYLQEHFDWEGDRPLRHTASDTVIYETHVRGCTIHPSSGVANPGTYRGLVERIPYFNATTNEIDFTLPAAASGRAWHVAVDTARDAPEDLFPDGKEPVLANQKTCRLAPRSTVILIAECPH